jgi:hypothetical protein
MRYAVTMLFALHLLAISDEAVRGQPPKDQKDPPEIALFKRLSETSWEPSEKLRKTLPIGSSNWEISIVAADRKGQLEVSVSYDTPNARAGGGRTTFELKVEENKLRLIPAKQEKRDKTKKFITEITCQVVGDKLVIESGDLTEPHVVKSLVTSLKGEWKMVEQKEKK